MPLIVDTPVAKPWGELFVTALFENDHAILPDRIAEAERALMTRARELARASGDHIEEQESMEDAMYALHALRNAQRAERARAQHRVQTA